MKIEGLSKRELRIMISALELMSSKTFEALEACMPRPGFPPVKRETIEDYHEDIQAIGVLYDEVRRGRKEADEAVSAGDVIPMAATKRAIACAIDALEVQASRARSQRRMCLSGLGALAEIERYATVIGDTNEAISTLEKWRERVVASGHTPEG